MPVLFFLQLVGLALGFDADEMGLGQHRVKVDVPALVDALGASV